MTAQILTQERLKELLHYDPGTGVFTRNGKTTHLGCYVSLADAKNARKSAESKLGYHANHGRPHGNLPE